MKKLQRQAQIKKNIRLSGMVSVQTEGKVPGRKKRKYGVCSLDRLEETGNAWRTAGLECSGLEESVVKEMCLEKLREGLGRIREQDALLIRLLFFEEVTVKDAAWICGCSSRTVQNRRKRILGGGTPRYYGRYGHYRWMFLSCLSIKKPGDISFKYTAVCCSECKCTVFTRISVLRIFLSFIRMDQAVYSGCYLFSPSIRNA